MIKIILAGLTLMLSVTSYGQGRVLVGNGGDVVVCRDSADNSITSVELLDFYEINAVNGFSIQMPPDLNQNDALTLLLTRLQKYDTHPSEVLQELADQFLSEAKFINDVELVDIQDSDHIFFPRGCAVEQIVVQKTPEFPGEKRYYINQQLWAVLNNSNKAGLIVHEVLFRLALRNKKTINSKPTRFLTGVLGANRLDTLSFPEYYRFMSSKFNFEFSNVEGHLAKNILFDSEGNIKSYRLIFIDETSYLLPNGENIDVNKDSSIYVARNTDYIKSVKIRKPLTPEIIIKNRKFDLDAELSFNEEGHVTSIKDSKTIERLPIFHAFDQSLRETRCRSVEFLQDGSKNIWCNQSKISPISYSKNFRGYPDLFFNYLVQPNNKIKKAVHLVSDDDNKNTTPGVTVSYHPNGAPSEIVCLKVAAAAYYSNGNDLINCPIGSKVTFYDTWQVKEGGYSRRLGGYKIGGKQFGYIYSPNALCSTVQSYQGYPNGRPKFLRSRDDIIDISLADGTKTFLKELTDVAVLTANGEITKILRNDCPKRR